MFRVFFNTFKTTFSVIKKVFIVLFVFALILTVFGAFTAPKKMSLQEFKDLSDKRIEQTFAQYESDKSEEGKSALAVFSYSMCSLIGEGCSDESLSNHSLFGGIVEAFAYPYANPPASGIAWVQDSLDQAGFIPSTYAAEGLGFTSIKGYISFWKIMRNLAYLLLVLIMVAIGFLIMFRVKLGDQAAITLQAALPRIVMALILITFSFAIVGFLIDLMYIVINLGISIIFNVGIDIAPFNDPNEMINFQNTYTNAHFGNLWPGEGTGSWGVGYAMYGVIPEVMKGMLMTGFFIPMVVYYSTIQTFMLKGITTALSGVGFTALVGGDIGNLPQILTVIVQAFLMVVLPIILPGFIINIIILLTILLFMFKIFFLLVKSYIKILIYTMFAPIIIMFSAIPGNKSFSWWFKNVAGELSCFPVVILLQVFGAAITAYNMNTQFAEPFYLPFLYNIQPADLSILVGLGIVLMTPDFIKMVKGWIGVEESPINFGLGTFFEGGSAVLSGVTNAQGSLGGWRNLVFGHDPHRKTRGIIDSEKGVGKQWSDFLGKLGV